MQHTSTCTRRAQKELAKLELNKKSGKISRQFYKTTVPALKRSIKRCSMTPSQQKASMKAEFAQMLKKFRKTFKKSN